MALLLTGMIYLPAIALGGVLLLALSALYLSLRLFDRVFEGIDASRLRERYLSRWRGRSAWWLSSDSSGSWRPPTRRSRG